MNEAASQTVPSLVIRRTYASPRERVYAAWTDPEIAAQFLCPKDVKAVDIAMDVRVGGAYTITMVLPDGERMKVGGVYREVVKPERLAMTWRWEEDDPRDECDTLLTLDLLDRGGQTELVLTHEGFKSEQSRDNHNGGWTSIVEKLARIV